MALPHPLDELRKEIANAIATLKSYDVPEYLERLGLPLFEETPRDAAHRLTQFEQAKAEAFTGKSRFVLKRLPLDEAELLKIADTALQDIKGGHYELEEEVWKRKERSRRSRITEVTRRGVLDNLGLRFSVRSIGGKLDIVELVGRNWPLGTMQSTDARHADASGDSDAEMQFSIQKRSEAHELLSRQDRAFRVACEALLPTNPSLRPMP